MNRELAVHEADGVAAKWLKGCHITVEDVMNAVGKEQFLNTLPTDKKLCGYSSESQKHVCRQASWGTSTSRQAAHAYLN